MPRQARLDAPGTLHHVIIRGIEKRKIVNDDVDRDNFVSRMGQLISETDMNIFAWALMPNHAHMLIRSGQYGLSKFMRRLLTGYAISYNHRHKRHGHLFQDRYKSIICEEDVYFKELARYIHLNPLRGKIVEDMTALGRYPWCGHGVVMGRIKRDWQDRKYVLRYFGKKEMEAKETYREFVKEGIVEGKRPELVGGGLIRSLGGWSKVLSMRMTGEQDMYDERILGSGEFVEQLLQETDENTKHYLPPYEKIKIAEAFINKQCEKDNININELKSGSRRRYLVQARSEIAVKLVEDVGISLAEAARQLGITTSAICKIIDKNR